MTSSFEDDVVALGRKAEPHLGAAIARIRVRSRYGEWLPLSRGLLTTGAAASFFVLAAAGSVWALTARHPARPVQALAGAASPSPSSTASSIPTPASSPSPSPTASAPPAAVKPSPSVAAKPAPSQPTVTLTLANKGQHVKVARGTIIKVVLQASSGGPWEAPYDAGPDPHHLTTLSGSAHSDGSADGTFQAESDGTAGIWAYQRTGQGCEACGPNFAVYVDVTQ